VCVCVCVKKNMYFWVVYGIFKFKIDDIQFCIYVLKCTLTPLYLLSNIQTLC
jgi:hypothetical protein